MAAQNFVFLDSEHSKSTLADGVCSLNYNFELQANLTKAQELAEQLHVVNEQLTQRNMQVEKELYTARQLQQSLLPKALDMPTGAEDSAMFTYTHFLNERLRVTGIYLPCDSLGGDIYDVFTLNTDSLGISISDVSGHGVAAGFITAIFKACLYRITQQTYNPSDVLFRLNNELMDIVKTGDYVTGLYLNVDLNTLQVDCAGAGHPYPFYYKAAGNTLSRLDKNGTPLVWCRDLPFPQQTVDLAPGDKLFLFTDGVSELKRSDDTMLGEETLHALLNEHLASGEKYPLDSIISALSDFTEGETLQDDISMVLIEAL